MLLLVSGWKEDEKILLKSVPGPLIVESIYLVLVSRMYNQVPGAILANGLLGNRVRRGGTFGGPKTTRKYIVDINSKLPTILCELDDSDGSLETSYIYADAQILAQYTHNDDVDETINERFYYVHDRLGSVRLMVDYDDSTDVVGAVNTYTYNPFGDHYDPDISGTTYNPWQFTGQYNDEEIGQYHLRARQYDPTMMRLTTRDPVRGKQNEPLTLHRYLYCLNDPVDRTDPSGEISAASLTNGVVTGYSLYGHGVSLATYAVSSGDDRFWALADITFKFMPVAILAASINPYGPVTNVVTSAAIHINQMAYGSTTGMSTVQGFAVDALAFFVYRGVMGRAHKNIGTNANDMENFMIWMGVDWVEQVNGY